MKTKVIVTERPVHDLSAAAEFGELHFLLNDGHKSTWKTDQLTSLFLNDLERLGYNPERDFVLVVGNTILLVTLIGAIAAEYGYCKVLFFHARDSQYVERVIGYQ